MARTSTYPPEPKERAVRLVFESKDDYPSEFEAIRSIGTAATPSPRPGVTQSPFS